MSVVARLKIMAELLQDITREHSLSADAGLAYEASIADAGQAKLVGSGTAFPTAATFLFLTSNREVTVTLGTLAGNEAFTLAAGGIVALSGVTIDEVHVDNDSGATATVLYKIAGS